MAKTPIKKRQSPKLRCFLAGLVTSTSKLTGTFRSRERYSLLGKNKGQKKLKNSLFLCICSFEKKKHFVGKSHSISTYGIFIAETPTRQQIPETSVMAFIFEYFNISKYNYYAHIHPWVLPHDTVGYTATLDCQYPNVFNYLILQMVSTHSRKRRRIMGPPPRAECRLSWAQVCSSLTSTNTRAPPPPPCP